MSRQARHDEIEVLRPQVVHYSAFRIPNSALSEALVPHWQSAILECVWRLFFLNFQCFFNAPSTILNFR